MNFRKLEKNVELMEPEHVLKANILANLEEGYEELKPFKIQKTEAVILAGGPSLKLFKGFKGPIFTVNGAYNWAVAKGYQPKAQFIVDPREWNKRFTQPVVPGCKYIIGSQCHPAIAKSVPKEQVWLWHGGDMAMDILKGRGGEYYPVFGGSTVMLRALPTLMMLGLRRLRIYGFDSCWDGRKHHAYEQKENDGSPVMEISLNGRTFYCNPWMAVQAQEFVDLVKHMLPEDCELVVHGKGLIAHILKTGAHYGGISLESLQRGQEVPSDRGHRLKHEPGQDRTV
jgi:hypothetical protein